MANYLLFLITTLASLYLLTCESVFDATPGLRTTLEPKLDQVLGNRLKQFEKELADSALEIAQNHGLEENRLVRKKRSVPLHDGFHHSYIFDILPDQIDELYIDGTTHASVEELKQCFNFFYLPVLGPHRQKENLFILRDEQTINFYIYDSINHTVTSASLPLIAHDLVAGCNTTELYDITLVTKNIQRLDLARLLIITATDSNHNFYIRLFEVDYRLSNDSESAQIYKKVSAVGIDYTHHDQILSLDATVGDSVYNRKRGQYRVWIAALVQKKTGDFFVDVYSVEDFQGWYRYSTVQSYFADSAQVNHVQIFKIFEFIVIVEISKGLGPTARLTYFVEHEQVDEPYQTDLKVSNGSITSVEFVKYGSRAFFLISNEGNGQYMREIVSHGNKLIFENFDVINVPSGQKWLVVNVPGCRDEKLIYLFYKMHGVVQVYLGKLLKFGLERVHTKDLLPVYYMAPGQEYFSTNGTQHFDYREIARKACLNENACSGVIELESKTYILGYKTGVVPTDAPLTHALIKYEIEDGPDLFGLLTNSDPDFNCIYSYTANGQAHIVIKLLSGEAYVVDIASHLEVFERKVVLQNAEIYNKLKNLTVLVEEHERIVNRTLEVLDKAVQNNGTQITTGNFTFTNFTSKKKKVPTAALR